jgi:hypothetical protein
MLFSPFSQLLSGIHWMFRPKDAGSIGVSPPCIVGLLPARLELWPTGMQRESFDRLAAIWAAFTQPGQRRGDAWSNRITPFRRDGDIRKRAGALFALHIAIRPSSQMNRLRAGDYCSQDSRRVCTTRGLLPVDLVILISASIFDEATE